MTDVFKAIGVSDYDLTEAHKLISFHLNGSFGEHYKKYVAAVGAALAAQLSDGLAADDEPQVAESSGKPETSGGGFSWFGGNKSGGVTRLLTVGIFLSLVGVIFVIWRRSS